MLPLRSIVKRVVALFSLLLLAAAGSAAADPDYHGNESAAATDDAIGFLVNPAAGGIRYPAEIAFGFTEPVPDGPAAGFGVLALGRIGLAHEDRGGGHRRWTLALGGEEHRGLRLGSRVQWLDAPGGGAVPDWSAGFLSRPAPWLSLGGVGAHLLEPRVAGVRREREWTAAIALRPLGLDRARAHRLAPRLTLSADAIWREDDALDRARLRFGGELELAAGLALKAGATRGGWQAGVALLAPRSTLAARSAFDRDGARLATTWMASLHRGEERSALPGARGRVATLVLGGPLADEPAPGGLLEGGTSSAGYVHRVLERALDDPRTRGVLLELRGVSGMAQLEELRPRIARLRAAGKPVVAFLEYGGGRGDLYLAAACDRIVTSEEAFFAGLGLRVERRSYRSALARHGITVERSAIGRYKSAWRSFSVDSTTDADEESIDHLLDRSQELFVAGVSGARGLDPARLVPALDGRAWHARDLAALGVVDSIGYREDALRILGRLAGLGPAPRAVDLARHPPAHRDWHVRRGVAIVYASGEMMNGRSANDPVLGAVLGAETLSRTLESAFTRDDVAAVVLRIESPGGLVTAANLMHHAAARWKRETGKPLIVSMGRVAASGGYYLATAADHIVLNRHTATGSIGVVFIKPSLEGFYAKHGVRQEFFERGGFMRGTSLAADWDARLQAAADSAVARTYEGFLRKVAEGRGLPPGEVRQAAEGRVWLGDDAVALRLADRIGGLDEAVREARRRAGIPEGERIAPVEYRRPRGTLIERLLGAALGGALERARGLAAGPAYRAGDTPDD